MVRRASSVDVVVAEHTVGTGPLTLAFEAQGRRLTYSVTSDEQTASGAVDIGFLGQQVNGYFYGLLVGPFAYGRGGGHADVDWFEYENG